MTFRGIFLIVAAALLIAALPSLGAAQWSPKQKTDFTADCLERCKKNPKVPQRFQPKCPDFCNCLTDEGQKILNETQFDQMRRDAAARKTTPQTNAFSNLNGICNKAFLR